MKTSRHQAVQILLQVIKRSKRLGETLLINTDSLTKEICYGVLRFYLQLQAIALLLLEKPIKHKDQDVFLVILIGLYQLRFLNIPEHAVVHETVAICNELKKPWAKGLVNGILRNYQRQKNFYLTETAHFSHPLWLINKIRHYWPEYWQEILEHNNQRPPMCLRVNQQRIDYSAYLRRNDVQELHPKPVKDVANAILINPTPVEKIPGFTQGLVSIQDAGAQLAANLLKLAPNQYVLDACAAPGGKTSHLLEQESSLKVIAIDSDKNRLTKVNENLRRLNLTAQVIEQDANLVANWWDGQGFDRILLDAPCSGSGVIRRHPDIKLLRRETDICQFQEQQLTLLKNLWPTLTNNGLLLYVTCSILPEENDQVIMRFCQQTLDVTIEPLVIAQAVTTQHGQQLLPSAVMDGFYYCLLRRQIPSATNPPTNAPPIVSLTK